MSGEKKSAQTRAFNTRFLVIIPFLGASGYGLFCLEVFTKNWIFVMVILLASVICLLLEPIYYVFNKTEMVFVFLFGYKKHLTWQNVSSVSKWRPYEIFSFPKGHYTVHYGEVFRGRYIQQFVNLPITRRIKDCFKKYYSGSIQGEDTPKKKKRK